MNRSQHSIGGRLAELSDSTYEWFSIKTRGVREAHSWIDRIALAQVRYYRRSVGRQATVTTYAAYFLGFPLLVIFLLIIEALLRASPRADALVRSMLDVDPNADLSRIVGTTSDTSIEAFVGFVGMFGVVLAAAATASSLRSGLASVFGLTSPRRSLLRAPALDFSAGLWLAAVVLASWVLALSSLSRRGVVNDVVGASVPGPAILAIKLGSVGLAIALVSWSFSIAVKQIDNRVTPRSRWLGAGLAAVFLVACNYLFIYFVVSTMVDPEGGGGFGLALVLLLWVSATIRGLFFIACWVAVQDGEPDAPHPVSADMPARTD